MPSDVQLQQAVLAEFRWDPSVNAAHIGVTARAGVVGVSNDISIKSRLTVLNISDNIKHALHRSWLLNPETISVSAEDGRVLLTGTVHSLHDREVTAAAAWAVLGTTAVENEITVA